MIELFENDIRTNDRQSSKGNQLKWEKNRFWYKADYLGYEGLAEYLASHLLERSSLEEDLLTLYRTEKICYNNQTFTGCVSRSFLEPGEQMLTLERLYKNETGQSLYQAVFLITSHADRLSFLINQVERYTGLHTFGKYIAILLTIDAVFLNEDRHFHNIAVIIDSAHHYRLCPVFDLGAGLLSDLKYDYPMGENIYDQIGRVKSKSICDSFDEQLDLAEEAFGENIHFRISKNEVEKLLETEPYYPKEIKNRVRDVLFWQMHRYPYLFK